MNTKLIKNISLNRSEIDRMAEEYLQLTGRKVCKSCESDLQLMYSTLNIYHMESNFKLKNGTAIYKIKKGEAGLISQSRMTDELAVKFLKVDPERIKAFSQYPENWEEMLEDDFVFPTDLPEAPESDLVETTEEISNTDVVDPAQVTLEDAIDEAESECEECGEEPCSDCLRKELLELKMNELRAKYPEVKQDKGSSKEAFVDKIIAETQNQ